MEHFPQPGAHGYAWRDLLSRHEPYFPSLLPGGEAALSAALLQSCGIGFEDGHRATLLENDTVFDAIETAIRAARESVHVLVYIWRPCAASDRLVAALQEKARSGVACRVVVDPVGSEEITGERDFDRRIERALVSAGVQVHYYRLLSGRIRRRVVGRNHQKLVIVDGRVGFTGGFGIWKVWEGDGRHPDSWRELSVRVEGPVVRQMQVAFASGWQSSGGALLPEAALRPPQPAGPARAAFVRSSGRLGVTEAERMYRLVFGAARERLWITNAYFNPPNPVLTLLEDKCRQGVDVRVLAPGPHHDVVPIRAAQRSTYPRLLRAGVRIWEYQPAMLHAKTAIVDDWLSVIGSINLDTLSLNKLVESALLITDRGLHEALVRAFEGDLRCAREMRLPYRVGPYARLSRRATEALGRGR
ncbi:MAG: phospholipase D-like domain-containing protein [Myxococcales bacterium]